MTEGLSPLPVERFLTAVDAGLHGHRRDKSRLLEELRSGLIDATAAQLAGGLTADQASAHAIRQFGSVGELVQACQPELSVRQVRRTARAVALTVPALIALWQALFGTGAHQLPHGAVVLGGHLAGLGAATAALSALTLVFTGRLSRWLPAPRQMPTVTAVIGFVSATTMTVAPLAMAALCPPEVALWPLALLAAAIGAIPLSTIARSAWLCRTCAVASN